MSCPVQFQSTVCSSFLGGSLFADPSEVDDRAAQLFVDADALTWAQNDMGELYHLSLDLRYFSSMTRVPLRISDQIRTLNFAGCTSLTSVAGLPPTVVGAFFIGCAALKSVSEGEFSSNITWLVFDHCASLMSVTGLPASVVDVSFIGCTALARVTRFPFNLHKVDFSYCTSLTTATGLLPLSVKLADFTGCRRLRRFSKRSSFVCRDLANPASEVRAIMRSGVCEKLIARVGHDVALLVGCFATAGLNTSPQFADHMETQKQVSKRYARCITATHSSSADPTQIDQLAPLVDDGSSLEDDTRQSRETPSGIARTVFSWWTLSFFDLFRRCFQLFERGRPHSQQAWLHDSFVSSQAHAYPLVTQCI